MNKDEKSANSGASHGPSGANAKRPTVDPDDDLGELSGESCNLDGEECESRQ